MNNIVQFFFPWEVILYLDLMLKTIDQLFPNVEKNLVVLNLIIENQIPVTVDQFRKYLGFYPHPDSARGQLFLYQPDPGTANGDNRTVPDAALVLTWNNIVTQDNGQTTHDDLESKYQALYTLAEVAASNLDVQLL